MVLRGTSRAGSPSAVGSSIDGGSENLVREDGIVGHNSCGQVMRDALTDVEHLVNLSVAVLSHNLEWSEQLSRQQLSLLVRSEMLQGHEDSRGLPGSIALGDRVILERSTSEDNFSTFEL